MITYKATPFKLSAVFSAETLQARREHNDILKILKNKTCLPRILYPERLSFRYEGEIKAFPDKQKLRELLNSSRALKEILKGALLPENKK